MAFACLLLVSPSGWYGRAARPVGETASHSPPHRAKVKRPSVNQSVLPYGIIAVRAHECASTRTKSHRTQNTDHTSCVPPYTLYLWARAGSGRALGRFSVREDRKRKPNRRGGGGVSLPPSPPSSRERSAPRAAVAAVSVLALSVPSVLCRLCSLARLSSPPSRSHNGFCSVFYDGLV